MILSVEEWRAKAKAFLDIVSSYMVIKYPSQDYRDTSYQEKLSGIIANEPDKCNKVTSLLNRDYEAIMGFFDETGKKYYMTGGNEEECGKFLNDYFFWLANKTSEGYKEEEVIETVVEEAKEAATTVTETIRETITIIKEIPGKIIPDSGILGIGNKVLLGVVGVIVALVVILIILVKVK